MINEVLYAVLLLIAGIIGIVIANNTKDELKQGRKWFIALFMVSLILGIFYMLYGRMDYGITFFALVIISGISIFEANRIK